MKWLRHSERTPIGVDLGRRYVKAAQLGRAGHTWRVEAATTFPRRQPGAGLDRQEARHIYKVLARQGFAGNNVVLAVPRESLLTGILELPSRSSGAPVDQIARMELSRLHKCQPDTLEMAYWELPAGPHDKGPGRVMAVGCTHACADALLDCLEGEGLEVQALDVHAGALARACQPMLAADGITCLLDIGWEAAWLLVIHRGAVVYERTLGQTGIRPLFEALDEQLDMEPDMVDTVLCEIGVLSDPAGCREEWAAFEDMRGTITSHMDTIISELRLSFSYAMHQCGDATVGRLVVVGGGAMLPGVAEYLGSHLNLDVHVASPTDLMACPPALLEKCGSPALTMAVGLALFSGE